MILSCFLKALAQMTDPRFRRVLLTGLGLTVAGLVGAYLIVLFLIQTFVGDEVVLPLIGQVTWVSELLSWGSLVLMLGLSVFLMVPVASAVISLFLDQVAEAVEARHYPQLPPAPGQSLIDGLRDSLGFLGLLIAINLAALVLYLLLPVGGLVIFWLVNGYLLGREYFQVASARRLGRAEARALFRAHRGTIWAAGTLMAIPLTLPLVNLVIPILGAASFTHLFHALRSDRGPSG